MAKASYTWKNCRPLWFRLPQLCRVFTVFTYVMLAPLRERWVFDPQRIRALILVRDLYSALPDLVNALLAQGLQPNNIIMLDSGSSAPACLASLAALEQRGCRWIRLSPEEEAFGPYAPWLSHTVQGLIRSWRYPYLVTDPDLALSAKMPNDWLSQLFKTLCSHRFVLKVSLPLSIDNLSVPNSSAVVTHEQKLLKQPAYKILTRIFLRNLPGASVCTTDTTLSIYRPSQFFSTLSIRLPSIYELYHLPWYDDYFSSSEYKYYQVHKLSFFGEWSSIAEIRK